MAVAAEEEGVEEGEAAARGRLSMLVNAWPLYLCVCV